MYYIVYTVIFYQSNNFEYFLKSILEILDNVSCDILINDMNGHIRVVVFLYNKSKALEWDKKGIKWDIQEWNTLKDKIPQKGHLYKENKICFGSEMINCPNIYYPQSEYHGQLCETLIEKIFQDVKKII